MTGLLLGFPCRAWPLLFIFSRENKKLINSPALVGPSFAWAVFVNYLLIIHKKITKDCDFQGRYSKNYNRLLEIRIGPDFIRPRSGLTEAGELIYSRLFIDNLSINNQLFSL